jgi:hypothetical protein
MAYLNDGRLPIIYVRGFAGSGVDKVVDDPFYGFNEGSVHVRVDGTGAPRFHQFESPLLRLLTEERYRLLVHGDQRAYLENSEDGAVEADTLWIHRFYDVSASTLGRRPAEFSLERAADDLFELIRLVRRKTGAPKVFLIAHSMGGLICRSVIQRVIPNASDPNLDPVRRLRDADRYIARVFTYATPHGGIEFAVGWGLLEAFRDMTGFQGADIFGPDRMYEYLTPDIDGAVERDDFDARLMPAEGYPLDNLFCLVGTNPENYTAALGLSSKVTGARSDGLVQIDNAYVEGAHRAMVHRSHSGRYGIVNSEEGYQNLRRFLFGDLKITVDLVGLEVPGTEDDHVVWQLETALSIRGLPVLVHEQRTAHHCPVQIERRRAADSVDTPVPLLTTFLSSRALRPTDRAGRPLPLRHALTLRLISVRERDGVFSFLDHLEQTEDWHDVLVVDVAPGEPQRAPAAWAVWNSVLPASIRDWTPDEAYALVDTDPQPGRWRGCIPLPAVAHNLVGVKAHVRLTVTPRYIGDIGDLPS